MHIVQRTSCRVCGSRALVPVIDLGPQYLQGAFLKPGKRTPPLRRVPTKLVRCDPTQDERACGLVQLTCSVPPEILYSVYWYRSGTNRTMREHLRGIAEEAAAMVKIPCARVLDIGCNDGTLLGYYPAEYVKFGVDPSDIAQGIGGGVTVVREVFPSPTLTGLVAGKTFDVITSIAMFYDLEDPIGFVREIKRHLAADGLWVAEMAYLPLTLRLNSYDTICHEHIEYYSLAVLEHIMRAAGMKVVRATLNDINGGSIRCYVSHAESRRFGESSWEEGLADLRRQEFELELDTERPYAAFRERVEARIRELGRLIRSLRVEGKRIHVYGASTKGNTILQACGLDHTALDCAADRNPEKHGARTIGTDIPVVSEEESRALNPDYYLVLPWHFREEFLERERETLERGTGMIFPLPDVTVVTAADLRKAG